MEKYSFKSVFAPHFYSFIKMKTAMGFAQVKFNVILKEFDLFFIEKNVSDLCITQSLVSEYLSQLVII